MKTKQLLGALAAVEKMSEHPLAEARVSYVEGKEIEIPKADKFRAIRERAFRPGGRSDILCGSKRFIEELGMKVEKVMSRGKQQLFCK
jgi:cation transport ATPase